MFSLFAALVVQLRHALADRALAFALIHGELLAQGGVLEKQGTTTSVSRHGNSQTQKRRSAEVTGPCHDGDVLASMHPRAIPETFEALLLTRCRARWRAMGECFRSRE